jgi:hypothetical protein
LIGVGVLGIGHGRCPLQYLFCPSPMMV